jgi:hypothetical protein
MVLKPVKKLLWATGLCGLLAAELLAQGGLGAPPGQMGGGARSGSSGRIAAPNGRIPSAVTPSDSGKGASPGLLGSGSPPQRTSPSRPVGNILFPGTPDRSNHGSIGSPGLPGIVGQPSILSPGLPGPYRPGNVLTPGTPSPVRAPTPHPGGIFARPGIGRGPADTFPGRGRFERRGRSVIVYPYIYFGYPYGNGGYAVETGAVSKTSSSASYVIEGHLDTTSPREPHSRVYEVGPNAADIPPDAEAEPAEGDEPPSEAAPAEPAGGVFYLIALKGGLIYAAREHWLLGNTVHFVTLQDEHYVVSLQEVDLDLSAQLNRERGMKFALEVREQGGARPPDPGANP